MGLTLIPKECRGRQAGPGTRKKKVTNPKSQDSKMTWGKVNSLEPKSENSCPIRIRPRKDTTKKGEKSRTNLLKKGKNPRAIERKVGTPKTL